MTATEIRATDDRVVASVPAPLVSPTGPLDVAVVTSAGQQVVLAGALTVVAPSITALGAAEAHPGDSVTLSGRWTDTAGPLPTVLVSDVEARHAEQFQPGRTLTFTVPDLVPPPTPVAVRLAAGSQVSDEPTVLTVTAPPGA
jgi:hypothetical protein